MSESRTYTYMLPSEDGQAQRIITNNNSVIIIGANGSGKSQLGAWIEKHDFEKYHRIGAQRNLNFNENISLKNYQQAEDYVFYGSDHPSHKPQKTVRWNSGNDYTTKLMDDFENVLAALIALKNNENDKFVQEYKIAEEAHQEKPCAPITSIDKLMKIWDAVFPQRKLEVNDSKFYAVFEKNGQKIKYASNKMSDGERAALYLISQVLCVPKDKNLIIDEPEVHLHRSIMNRLWQALENARPDCLFIYITHDTQFAAMHNNADKVWIKDFDGTHWKLQSLGENSFPEELLLDILGSRKNILFVEGEKGSYDTQLYQELYPDYYVIPCGSCVQVIARTKAFKSNPQLHHCNVFGIIDRDFRSDYEIEKYKKDDIFTLKVAEVENLFLVRELVEFVATHLELKANDVFASVFRYVKDERFARQINRQICNSISANIKYKLNSIEISGKKEEEAKVSFDTSLAAIDFDAIKSKEEKRFKEAIDSNNYTEILKVFNEKGILSSIGGYFNLQNKEYPSLVLRLLQKDTYKKQIIEALNKYIPQLPSFNGANSTTANAANLGEVNDYK